MTLAPPEGTRDVLPESSHKRLEVIATLRRLYDSWGYESVELPALEHYDPNHPAADRAFKLSDRDSRVLTLRADFTPAIARLVKRHYPEAQPRRFQYCGPLWHTVVPDFARAREFTQVGVELIGASTPRADAELVHLARESVRAVGLKPRVELGHPGFVRLLFDLAEIPEAQREGLARAIDHKDVSTLAALLEPLALPADLHRALAALPDLYGDVSIIALVRRLAPWPETEAALDHLGEVLAEFEDDSELLLDLGMARRLSYYTGIMFHAYTFDFGQPLLGGGRYDGALLPYAAGFALGLERLLSALQGPFMPPRPMLLSLSDPLARYYRAHGYSVERTISADPDEARAYARARGIPYLLSDDGLTPLTPDAPERETLEALWQAASETVLGTVLEAGA